MKKRIIVLVLVLIFLTGCNSKASEKDAKPHEDTLGNLVVSSNNPKESSKSKPREDSAKNDTSFFNVSNNVPSPKRAQWDPYLFGRAIWTTVEGAKYYQVVFNDLKFRTEQTYIDLADLLDYDGINTFQVSACVNGNFGKEKGSNKLDLLSEVYWDEYPDGMFDHNVNSDVYEQTNTWIQENGSWYYLNQYGIKAAGWLDNNGTRHYMNGDGSMVTGWIYIGASFYLDPEDGHMVCSARKEIDGKDYLFDNQGRLVTSVWMQDKNGKYYVRSDGTICKSGMFTVGTDTYYTDENGYIIPNE